MTLRIEEVPESVVIISPEDAKKWELYCGNKPKNWMKRCDYLLIGKTDGGYFAIFVELKKRLREKTIPNMKRTDMRNCAGRSRCFIIFCQSLT